MQFLDPENAKIVDPDTVEMVQFLDPETVKILPFLDPEIVKMVNKSFMKHFNIQELRNAQQGLELEPLGRKNSTIVNIHLAWSQEAHTLSSTCLASVYDTFLG